jgi:uncharacterized membrane protein YfcA
MSAGICFAALCQGLTGFGFAVLSIPFLANFMGMKEAIVWGTGLCSVHYVLLAVRSYRYLAFRMNAVIILGTLIGMCFGLYVFILIDETTLKWITGIVICCSGALLACGRFPMLGDSVITRIIVGASSGLLQTTTGMGGPPYVIYYASRNHTTQEFRGNLISILVIIFLVGFFMLISTPIPRHLEVKDILFLLPPLVFGYELGVRLSKVISDRLFKNIVYILVIISGITLILGSYRPR